MAFTPFDEIPTRRFRSNAIWISLLLIGFLFLVLGVISSSAIFRPLEGPGTVVPFWQMAIRHYQELASHIQSFPKFCLSGESTNDLQASQCGDAWIELFKFAGLAFLPLIGGIYGWNTSNSKFQDEYRRLKKKVHSGKDSYTGTVTSPPGAASDIYSWFYCLRPIMVELKDQKQVKVYVSLDVKTPEPGSEVILFDRGEVFGSKRRVGMLYTPHIAVFKSK